ncbi:helix-turn-helix domain-containing protein [Magnetospira sp. QH-2]|uniref:helix-turn-helix domain-containing protein n=1 Tax=Magnetospira sp. (strain QH-2) TaxID=1288970 RepID=UPI0003E80DD3|nr:helix-turn-helix domain-containing protein [Magnetospira sp. QH-2]CCQ74508.1 putative Transcriptional regulator, AraC family [Magnetospira sp. QH-2]
MPPASAPAKTISHYALYGEREAEDDPEFIHIEDIRTRSRLYDWTITPHAHPRMYQFVYLVAGSAEVWLDQELHLAEAPCAVGIPGGVVHAFTFQPETVGWVLTVSELLLIDARYRRSRKLFDPLTREPIVLAFDDNPDEAAVIETMLEQMQGEFSWPQLGRGFMCDWLIRIVLMTARRQLDRQAPQPEKVGQRRELYGRFRQLVEEHYRNHWPISAYAEALNLSQARLNRLCKSFADKGAGDLVQDRLALEAQRHLIYTSVTVEMIAYELGFQDPGYFSRFFKRRTGMAPGRFRAAKMAEPFPH